MYLINIIISSIIIIAGIIIGTQNGNTLVDIHLFGWTFSNQSLSLVMLECVLIGMIIVLLIASFYEIKQRAKYWQSQKKITQLNKELDKLRTLIADDIDIEDKEKEEEDKEE